MKHPGSRALLLKTLSSRQRDLRRFPGRLRQKTAQACHGRFDRDALEQPRKRRSTTTQHQALQHDHEVLVLRTAETVREPLSILAQPLVYIYNRDSHRVSPRSKVSVASPVYRELRDAPTQWLKLQR